VGGEQGAFSGGEGVLPHARKDVHFRNQKSTPLAKTASSLVGKERDCSEGFLFSGKGFKKGACWEKKGRAFEKNPPRGVPVLGGRGLSGRGMRNKGGL